VYHISPTAKKRRKIILNNKLCEATEKLIKDKKTGRNYGTNHAGSQVDGALIVELKVEPGVDVEIKVEPGVGEAKKKKKAAKKSGKYSPGETTLLSPKLEKLAVDH
jgi:hypothetical protein